MKRRKDETHGRTLAVAGLGWMLAAIVWSGCDQKPPTSAGSPTAAPVKGEPIRGEPIAAPLTETKVAAAPVPGTNAVPPPAATVVAASVPTSSTASSQVAAPTAIPPVASSSASSALANTSAVPAVAAAKAGAGTPESPLVLGFDKLASFAYALPDGPVETNLVAQSTTTNQIPKNIRELNNRFVTLKGFMLPLKVEKGLVTELLIMRDQSMCCYGAVPKINEWVSVKMVGSGVKPVMDQAVTLAGKFKVGEMYENGYLVGIYAMDGEKMAGPLDL